MSTTVVLQDDGSMRRSHGDGYSWDVFSLNLEGEVETFILDAWQPDSGYIKTDVALYRIEHVFSGVPLVTVVT